MFAMTTTRAKISQSSNPIGGCRGVASKTLDPKAKPGKKEKNIKG